MDITSLVGALAASLVFLTFCMRSMLWLRLTAIASNLAFLGYAGALHLYPVLTLHAILLPLNCRRAAVEIGRVRGTPAPRARRRGHEAERIEPFLDAMPARRGAPDLAGGDRMAWGRHAAAHETPPLRIVR